MRINHPRPHQSGRGWFDVWHGRHSPTTRNDVHITRSSRVAEGVDPYGFVGDLLSRETVTPHPSAFGCHLLPLEKALNLDRPRADHSDEQFNSVTSLNLGETMRLQYRLNKTPRLFAQGNPSVHQGCSGVSVRIALIPPSYLKRWWKRGSKGRVYEFLKRAPWLVFFRLFLCRVTKK